MDGERLIGQISQVDLKGLRQSNFPTLLRPIGDWLAEYVPDVKVPPLFVTGSDTIERVLLLFASSGEHSLWVVDSHNTQRPIRLISLRDVIHLINSRLGRDWWEEEERPEDLAQEKKDEP